MTEDVQHEPIVAALNALTSNIARLSWQQRWALIEGLDHTRDVLLAEDAEGQVDFVSVYDALQGVIREMSALYEDPHTT